MVTGAENSDHGCNQSKCMNLSKYPVPTTELPPIFILVLKLSTSIVILLFLTNSCNSEFEKQEIGVHFDGLIL
jgi:hypothetical protein